MIKQVSNGFGFSRESMSLDEIRAAGPGGMFDANQAMFDRMLSATFMPGMADRKVR